MLSRFIEHTRCPAQLVEQCVEAHWSESGDPARPTQVGLSGDVGAAVSSAGAPDGIRRLIQEFLATQNGSSLALDMAQVLDDLRFERYIDNAIPDRNSKSVRSIVRNLYYFLRPLFPVGFRKHLQRAALKGWNKAAFPAWPVDFSTEDVFDGTLIKLLRTGNLQEIPFIWYWPERYSSCCILTHDVETRTGRDFCPTIMDMEAESGLTSAFELVPEKRYEVPLELLEQIRKRGCEICVHGLNHDGQLFSSKEVFFDRAPKINEYARKWEAVGFRSPVMYRNLDWFHALNFSYDMSVPNVGHLDPQRGGCCTVMPYFIGNVLELPLTTIQDYPLYNILNQRSLDIWKVQTNRILERHGLVSFIIHPDYTIAPWARQLYRSLLYYLAGLRDTRGLWMALPREVDAWWRDRHQMNLVNDEGRWRIQGPQAERARIAYASLQQGKLAYRFESSPV
jgi:hypothetical protein